MTKEKKKTNKRFLRSYGCIIISVQNEILDK